ncbi:hypothetical protein PQC36_gp097 [Proteus phage Vb_PmiP-P59]|uniref:Uncharacterized protein n=3 Tax=Privateervirus TaxID=2843440 RepID=A0A7L7SH40_9CAUD|nr:hypothetical protein HWD17_gp082 [Proteus phage Privateer]YP_010672224.1 hypothetical protein PQC36_gp097 [Proteus phage Vb_PmiP-P59]YP_010672341.1 hypothetical protein PQC37_gp078 [Proteus phage 3H10_20]QIN94875.1 hypothetical protein CPT_Privateer_082 [Proteus phage Privateer]QMV48267.1 hypothetical protein [Proteus phage Vb_PmiP-P59]QOC54864.1 hypothetical protein [Proteus phage 3H10_20]
MNKYVITRFYNNADPIEIEASFYAEEGSGFVFYVKDEEGISHKKAFITKAAVMMIEKLDK